MNLRRIDTIPRVVRFEGTRLGGKSSEAERRGKFSRFTCPLVFPEAGFTLRETAEKAETVEKS